MCLHQLQLKFRNLPAYSALNNKLSGSNVSNRHSPVCRVSWQRSHLGDDLFGPHLRGGAGGAFPPAPLPHIQATFTSQRRGGSQANSNRWGVFQGGISHDIHNISFSKVNISFLHHVLPKRCVSITSSIRM